MKPVSQLPYITDDNILRVISPKLAIEITEHAFIDFETAESVMPNKTYLDLPKFNGDFRAMPAYSSRYKIAAIKWVNSHKDNTHMPNVMATMIVNDAATGAPIAVFDATQLTALRTGASSAIATKYCTPNTATSLAFIGAGAQAITQFLCLNCIRDWATITIFDPNNDQSNQLKSLIQMHSNATVTITDTIQNACNNAC